MQVTLYSTTTCPYCKMLKNYLDEKRVSYTEKLVDQDDAAREEMMSKSSGYLGVPFTVIANNGQEQVVMGFDKHKLNETLGVKK